MKIDRLVMYRTYFRYGYIGTILLSNLLPQNVRVSTSKILWNLDDNRNFIYKNCRPSQKATAFRLKSSYELEGGSLY